MVGPSDTTTCSTTIVRRVLADGRIVQVVYINDGYQGAVRESLYQDSRPWVTYPYFKPLPRRRIPWEEPCYWRYLRGVSLTARANKQHIRKEMKWRVTARPVRAKPGTRTYFAPRSDGSGRGAF